MIQVHRLNKKPFYINHRLIETIETNPDTTIHMMSGQSFVVLETPEEIQNRIIEFERKIFYDKVIKIVDKDQ
jgi:flagellar protein FlbD